MAQELFHSSLIFTVIIHSSVSESTDGPAHAGFPRCYWNASCSRVITLRDLPFQAVPRHVRQTMFYTHGCRNIMVATARHYWEYCLFSFPCRYKMLQFPALFAIADATSAWYRQICGSASQFVPTRGLSPSPPRFSIRHFAFFRAIHPQKRAIYTFSFNLLYCPHHVVIVPSPKRGKR